ncbi:hypothetical protein [Streptomyces mirabilis]
MLQSLRILQHASSRHPALRGNSRSGKRRQNIYFWPLYTGTAIPIDQWRSRMWLDTWV